MVEWEHDIYNIAAYPVADAARYLQIPVPTLRSWLNGRAYPTKYGQQQFEPLIQRPSLGSPQLSFTNLVEAHVLRVIRVSHKVHLEKVRKALDYVSQEFNTPHPLVQEKFQTDGVDLFVGSMQRLINASRAGQLVMQETLKHLLTRVEWNKQGIASRLFPFVQTVMEDNAKKPLAIDPSISFGQPVITGTGVPTAIVAELYNAGDSIEDIAEEYGCRPPQIRAAIWFESQSRAFESRAA